MGGGKHPGGGDQRAAPVLGHATRHVEGSGESDGLGQVAIVADNDGAGGSGDDDDLRFRLDGELLGDWNSANAFDGDSLQGMITSYLEKSVTLFVDQQKHLRDQVQNVVVGDPLTMMRDIAEQNLTLWKEMQDGMLRAAGADTPASKRRK